MIDEPSNPTGEHLEEQLRPAAFDPAGLLPPVVLGRLHKQTRVSAGDSSTLIVSGELRGLQQHEDAL